MEEATLVQWINAWGTAVSAVATVILVAITGYYAYQTRRLVKVEADRSEFEAKRSELESRPYLEVRILAWGDNWCEPSLKQLMSAQVLPCASDLIILMILDGTSLLRFIKGSPRLLQDSHQHTSPFDGPSRLRPQAQSLGFDTTMRQDFTSLPINGASAERMVSFV